MKKAIMIVCLMLSLALLTGCEEKTPQTKEGFMQIMEEKGFAITDASNDADEVENVKSIVLAQNTKASPTYKIEFWEFMDLSTAEGTFDEIMEELDDRHSTKTMSVSMNAANYSSYSFIADGNYYVIFRIENTMLCSVSDKKYKSEIEAIFEDLGYKY